MSEGKIDTQGTVSDLQAQGLLDSLIEQESPQARQHQPTPDDFSVTAMVDKKNEDVKTPRKLIEDERQEAGGVKWSVYKTYLKAS